MQEGNSSTHLKRQMADMFSQLQVKALLTSPKPAAKICMFSEGPRMETNTLVLPFAELKILTVTRQTDVAINFKAQELLL